MTILHFERNHLRNRMYDRRLDFVHAPTIAIIDFFIDQMQVTNQLRQGQLLVIRNSIQETVVNTFVNLIATLWASIKDLPLHEQVEHMTARSGLREHHGQEGGERGQGREESRRPDRDRHAVQRHRGRATGGALPGGRRCAGYPLTRCLPCRLPQGRTAPGER